jgi:5-methylcytosine-specific restriction endonuclease McrA
MTAADIPPATPFDASYGERFRALAAALAQGDSAESRRLVEVIANPGALDHTVRPVSSLRRWTAVFARDSYTCRYCERQTIAPSVLRVVSHVFPEVFRFHPNWKTSETDAAYFVLSTSADHIVPVTRGGSDAPANIVTACWMCNGMKSNYLLSELRDWKLAPVSASPWRGLTEYLDSMIRQAGLETNAYLRRWSEAVRQPEAIES